MAGELAGKEGGTAARAPATEGAPEAHRAAGPTRGVPAPADCTEAARLRPAEHGHQRAPPTHVPTGARSTASAIA